MEHYFYKFIIVGTLLGTPLMIKPMEQEYSSSDEESGKEECSICFFRKHADQFRKLPNCVHQFCTQCVEVLPQKGHNLCPLCNTAWTLAEFAKDNQPALTPTHENQSASITWNSSRRNYMPFYVAGGLVVAAGIGYGAYKLYNYLTVPKRIQAPDLKNSTQNLPKEVLVKSVTPAAKSKSNRGPYNKRQTRKV